MDGMARAGTERARAASTRELLLRAAEQLFAERGIDGTRIREVTERAGQANSSALHYHFGSREGLLRTIVTRHRQRVDAVLAPELAALERGGCDGLPALVSAYVEAEASELAHESGLDCLRIVSQLAHETGFRDGEPHPALQGSALWRLFGLIAERTTDSTRLSEPLARERVELMVMTVGAAFADRARHMQAGRPCPVEDPAYRADLAAMVTAMLGAPAA
ncbi:MULTISPECIES: helix-turn-helix domain-containing protein [unclassified Streptomyces]|uniref:helix-turn-helix domain-containing protein n=1 Tax=unclassified Streptomyces TaxID=2593676 RepID=UPI002E1E94C7|nr:TetR/AcrR family transcriptional regulator [Streptomyces sp. NBC_01023]